MLPSPRVLLTIDYEPWFALSRRYVKLENTIERRNLDGGFTLHALDPVLEKLGDSKISFYLVGEIADWYPEIPQRIIKAGHELGLHCQVHRSLVGMDELATDIRASASWVKDYGVRVQKSVFECQVGQMEWVSLRDRLLREIKADQDSLRFYFLDEKAVQRIEHHGAAKPLGLLRFYVVKVDAESFAESTTATPAFANSASMAATEPLRSMERQASRRTNAGRPRRRASSAE